LNTTIHCAAVFFMSALMSMIVEGQVVSGKGFLPDENGTNLDDPQASKTTQQKVAPGTIIKDCPDCPEMVVLPSGSFLMGSPPDPEPDPFSNEQPKTIGEPDERPQHRVQIQSFAIGKYEVTQEQWYAVMGNNPSQNKGRTLPVEQVSWDDIQQFIANLNQKTGQKYRLPSESEWEYAARAGSTTIYPFGNSDSALHVYAWFSAIAGGTNPVGLKRPNQFGLFDMLGNVSEWTQDCWHENYVGAPADGSAWTSGCAENRQVARGGSWFFGPAFLRSALRGGYYPDFRFNGLGFRLARDR
jgi:formylglycine-generating enzyme required for sulfatase activity